MARRAGVSGSLTMSIPQQTVAAGTAVTTAGIATGFIAQAIPVLQFCSLLVGLIVGILTAIYTVKRMRGGKSD